VPFRTRLSPAPGKSTYLVDRALAAQALHAAVQKATDGIARARDRSVWFTADSVIEAFTPYSEKYGRHPSTFVFDAVGDMVERPHANIMPATEIECVRLMGVAYRTRPQLNAQFENMCEVPYGECVTVKQVIDGWVKDSVGWLPLTLDGETLFKAVEEEGSEPRLHFGVAPDRCKKDRKGKDRTRYGSWDTDDDGDLFSPLSQSCIPIW